MTEHKPIIADLSTQTYCSELNTDTHVLMTHTHTLRADTTHMKQMN